MIGQNVPFITGQFTNTNSDSNGAVNPFQTIERKDVGLTLRKLHRKSAKTTLMRLKIFQEVAQRGLHDHQRIGGHHDQQTSD